MRTVHYRVVSRLGKETTEENKLEVGMICDSYLMRIENLTPSNFFNPKSETSITKIKLEALREQRRVLNELVEDEEINEVTALKLRDRKSTRLNSSHVSISYAVFCLKKKKDKKN